MEQGNPGATGPLRGRLDPAGRGERAARRLREDQGRQRKAELQAKEAAVLEAFDTWVRNLARKHEVTPEWVRTLVREVLNEDDEG